MNFLSHIAYHRPDAPEAHRWKRIGKLFHDKERYVCLILLYGFRQGICFAKPIDEEHPYLHGDILYPVDEHDGKVISLHVGTIMTDEHGTYALNLEAFPAVQPVLPAGVWFRVSLEDGPMYKEEPCPF